MSLSAESTGLLVKPDVARRQMEAETPVVAPGGTPGASTGAGKPTGESGSERRWNDRGGVRWRAASACPAGSTAQCGSTPTRVGRDASRIADEVIAHLAGQVGAEVTVTLEIEASLPDGASDQIVRTVTENSRTLKFTSHGFESE